MGFERYEKYCVVLYTHFSLWKKYMDIKNTQWILHKISNIKYNGIPIFINFLSYFLSLYCFFYSHLFSILVLSCFFLYLLVLFHSPFILFPYFCFLTFSFFYSFLSFAVFYFIYFFLLFTLPFVLFLYFPLALYTCLIISYINPTSFI